MFKKIIIGIVLLFVLLIGGLIASTFIFKDEINEMVKQQINNELNASVDYSDYDLSIFSSFPDFKFSINDLIVIGEESFEGDTLAMIKELNFNLDAKKMYQDRELQVHSVYINELNLKTFVLADSSSSLNILKERVSDETKIDTTTESIINIAVESVIVENSNIMYYNALKDQEIIIKDLHINASVDYVNEKANIDAKSKMDGIYYASVKNNQVLAIEDVKIDAVADYINDMLDLTTETKLDKVSFDNGDTKLLKKAKVKFDGTLNADLDKKQYDIDQLISINDLKIDLDGTVSNPDEDIDLDLAFVSNQSTFGELLSIIPDKFLKDYKDIDVKGGFALKGTTKGIYNENSMPAFNLDMTIKDGYFKYPKLPTAVENINLTANLVSPKSDMSNLDLNIPKATFTVENEPIDMSLKMLDVKNDPFVDLKAKGKIDLKKVPDFYPIDGLKKIDGNLDADIVFKGKLSDVEKEKFENVDFQGDMKINDLVYESSNIDMPIKVKTMDLDFTPQYANMTNLDMTYGKSDFKATGKLENLIGYVLSDGEVKGNLNLNSNKIDLTEFMGEEETSSDKAKETIRVPKNVNFVTNANIKELIYDDIVMTNMKGGLALKDEQLNINSVSANMLGGNAKIDGAYSTKKVGKPVIDFKYDIKNFDIKQSFDQVNTIAKIAPIAQYLKGKFSSKLSFNSLLEDDFMPSLSMLNGLGDVNVSYASFMNFPLFKSVSDAVKIPLLGNLDDAAIKNAWTVFKIDNGRLNVEPFDYVYQDIKMNLQGSNGFDKTIDYTMKLTVPSNKFGNAASVANDWLSKQNIPLLNLSVPKEITFDLNLSGLLSKPKVKILKVTADGSDKGVVEQIASGVADAAKAEAERLAKEAADKLKKELEKQAKEAAEKLAKEAADRLAKEAADRAAKEAEKLLQDALKDKLPNFGF